MSSYCGRIRCNCKYCDEVEGCIFDSQGSGNVIDMPCYEEDKVLYNGNKKVRTTMPEEIFYLCDKKKDCNKSPSCINGSCMYTTDSNHAVKEPEFEIDIREWLNSFNTDSATECFTAVQELKKRLEDN